MTLKVFVGGVFNDEGGRASGYVTKLTEELKLLDSSWVILNGGTYDSLSIFLDSFQGMIGVLCWFCDVPNDKPKLVNNIQNNHTELKLIISKNNRLNKYSDEDLTKRIKLANANLLVEFKELKDKICATLHDNKSNKIVENELNISEIAKAIEKALK